ncbi:hypothetical protein HDU88_003647 [Geranomyces variabilis]|nr:hypothetical protein HDU88_003647 [Geranomyces variabilis]
MYQPSAPVYSTQPAPVYMQQQPSQSQFYPQPQQPQQVYTQQQQQVYSSPQPNYVSGPVYSVQPQMQQIGIPSTNVIVISQAVQRPPKDWNHSLFSCTEDCETCVLACLCPAVVYGMNKRDIAHRGTWFGDAIMYLLMQSFGFSGCLGGGSRTGIRAKYNIRL